MKTCAIFGASGHGTVVAEILELNGYQNITFFDDLWPNLTSVKHWNVSGDSVSLLKVATLFDVVVVAIGDNLLRTAKQRELVASMF